MVIETFKVFTDLAETGSFSKAAVLNGVTQSAVSQQIRALETKFQVMLVERGRRNFALTQEGQAFLNASQEILAIYTQLDQRLQALRNVVAGELRISSIYSIGLHELPPYLRIFRERFPDLGVRVEYRKSQDVYAQVAEGEADIGLVAYPAKRQGLQSTIFSEDEMVLICHPGHPLARQKTLRLGQLKGQKFIAFEPDVPTRKVIDRHLREHSVEIEQVMEFDNIETVKRAVEVESGVSIVPGNTVRQEVEKGLLALVKFSDMQIFRPLGALTRRSRAPSPAVKEFIAALSRPAEKS